MVDIRIDTHSLTGTKFQVVGSHLGWFEGADTPIINLEPGDYGFQQFGTPASFRFTVTPDGLIDYDDAYAAFLAGRGTRTLVVNGYRLTLDGTALSHDLKPTLEGAADLSRFHVHELVLAPAPMYSFLSAGGIKANFDFNVELDGQATVNEAYARFATFQEGTLAIRGYPITIDGRALAEDLLPLLLGVSTSLARDRTHELTLIPGAGYSFQTGAIVPDFQFELTPDGRLTVDPRFAAFATVAGRTLTVKPKPEPTVTTDAERVVSGQVTRSDGQPFAGGLVRAFHELDAGRGTIRLGEDTTDNEGRYTIRYRMLPGAESINLRVAVLDGAGKTMHTLPVVTEAKPIEVLDLPLPTVEPPVNTNRVDGRIFFEHGLPAEKIKLRLYRQGIGGPAGATLLTETTTDLHGVYKLPYAARDVTNLEVRAVNEAGQEVSLSKIVRNPGEREVLNLVAPTEVQTANDEFIRLQAVDDEFTRLQADLQPHLGAFSQLANIREDDEFTDLTVLHEKTHWNAKAITLAAMATKLSTAEETGLRADVLYGLLRAGLPSDKLQLARVSSEAFDQALEKARGAQIINVKNDDIAQIRKDFAEFSLNTQLGVQMPGSHASYGDMLKTLALDDDQQKKFAGLYLNHRGDPADLWPAVTTAGLGDFVPMLQQQGKLAFLTTNNPELTVKLQHELGHSDPKALVTKGFYKPETWLTWIDMVPSAFADKPTYSEDMARRVRISYSTEVTWHMIETQELQLEGAGFPATVGLFLKNAIAKGFKLGQMPIEQFVRANPDVWTDIDADQVEPTKQMVKTLQRVYQITPGTDAMKALLNAGLISAQDVLAYPLDLFLERFGDLFPSLEQARLVYRKAEQVSNVTTSLFVLARELENATALYATSPSSEIRQDAQDKLKEHFPTLERLFGSLDFCECEHCRSVLSPAAYLVDLLQFLEREPKVWERFLTDWKAKHGDAPYPFKNRDAFTAAGSPADTERTPYEILIERRPDIPNIQLTCENTQTVLPHIDLVNEILEYYVAHKALTADTAKDTGDATTAELLAEPQNIEPEAYTALQQAHYPLTLPFDLWLETTRQFCNYFETPLSQLLETFRTSKVLFAQRSDVPFAVAQAHDYGSIFFEILGLSPADVDIFTDAEPLTTWFDLYGFQSEAEALTEATDLASGQRIDLNSAKALSRRLGVSYKELVEIVRTGFVNPQLEKLIILHKLGIAIDDVLFFRAHQTRYEQNRDLLMRLKENPRSALSPADQQRYDALSKETWNDVHEAHAFVQKLERLAKHFPSFSADDWLVNDLPSIAFDNILVLHDLDTSCNFDQTTLQYADGIKKIDPEALLRMNLFVRLWRKLGWTIEETDRALQAFIPEQTPFIPAHYGQQPLKSALIYLAHLKVLEEQLKPGKEGRQKLLTLWTELPTAGKNPLYAQLFLTRSVLKSGEVEIVVDGKPQQISVFDDALGQYLTDTGLQKIAALARHSVSLEKVADENRLDQAVFAGESRIHVQYDILNQVQYLTYAGLLTNEDKARLATRSASAALPILLDAVQMRAMEFTLLNGHLLALQGALGMTAAEIAAVLHDNNDSNGNRLSIDTAPLSLDNVSLLYRYALLSNLLKLTVQELITLKQLSGLNPFKALGKAPLEVLVDDAPYNDTLGFINIVAQVKESGLTVADLDYLLRHRYDVTGKYRPDVEAMLTLTKTVAEGIRTIQREHAIPDDAGTLTEEVLRQKLGLVLPADVVARFLAMFNGTVEFSATHSVLQPEEQLTPLLFAAEPAISQVSYNKTSFIQTLTLRGVLFDERKHQLQTRFGAVLTARQQAIFAALLDSIQTQSQDFFAKYLQKQSLNAVATMGFLAGDDFAILFAPIPPVADGLSAEGVTAARKAHDEKLREQRARLAATFFPYLQRQLIRQLVLQTMTAATGVDATLIESLLTDPALLADPTQNDQPLLSALVDGAQRGLTATFYASPELPDPLDDDKPLLYHEADSGLRDRNNRLLRPDNSHSARFAGYLEVPTAGAYRFFVQLEKENAEATLRFDHLSTPLFSGKAARDGDELGNGEGEYLELKPGKPYRFTLELRKLNGGEARLLVQGEALPKDGLARLTLYPATAVERSARAQLLLAKSLQLIQALGLNEREVRYILTHAADFDNVTLHQLPTHADADTDAKAVALFGQFLRLAGYARLQRTLAGGNDDLISIFEMARTKPADDVYKRLAQITRREESTIRATARALFGEPSFVEEQAVDRLWQALQVVEKLGVPVGAIIKWTQIVNRAATEAQRFAIARDLKETLKARFEPESWLRVAQPIFDKLRQRQRDALVAHVMHQHSFERMEELFEYFLIDPGMEPVVQTSRIRAAISSVQIFIQRSLLNLERKVAPTAINAKHWQWMKRYRVWEANRKIFLFPENWLEPEFRDDKTHLFTELEGKLLQGDVSSDLVEDAFNDYLHKLAEVARLDIIALYCEENALDPASNTLHVFGRTYAEPYSYFYRRYVQQMWTPWEPISTEIEGNHIVPVVWRGRLQLFWVTFMDTGVPDAPPASGEVLLVDGQVNVDSLKHLNLQMLGTGTPSSSGGKSKQPEPLATMFEQVTDTVRNAVSSKLINVQLHWSEYFQGEWSTRKSGGVGASRTATVPLNFNINATFIHASKEPYDEKGEERGVLIHLNLSAGKTLTFRVISRNSKLESGYFAQAPHMPYTTSGGQANRYTGGGTLQVTFDQRIETEEGKAPKITKASPSILQDGGNFTLVPCANPIMIGGEKLGPLVAPLFYQDNRENTFFVEPTLQEKTIEEWQDWVTRTPVPEIEWERADWWNTLPVVPIFPDYTNPKLVDPDYPIWSNEVDLRARYQLENKQDWLTNEATVIQFKDTLVGATGRTGLAVLPTADLASATLLNVNSGSAISADNAVVVVEQDAFAQARLTQTSSGVNVVGGSGLNSALLKHVSQLNVGLIAGALGDGLINR